MRRPSFRLLLVNRYEGPQPRLVLASDAANFVDALFVFVQHLNLLVVVQLSECG